MFRMKQFEWRRERVLGAIFGGNPRKATRPNEGSNSRGGAPESRDFRIDMFGAEGCLLGSKPSYMPDNWLSAGPLQTDGVTCAIPAYWRRGTRGNIVVDGRAVGDSESRASRVQEYHERFHGMEEVRGSSPLISTLDS